MPNDTTLPYSVPKPLQGQTQEGFEVGKDKVLELFDTLHLVDFLKQFTQQVLPLQAAQWFALDCAKFVLPIFEELHPDDKRVREECIDVVESFLKGKSNFTQLSIAADAARASSYDATRTASYHPDKLRKVLIFTHFDNYNAYTAAFGAVDAAAAAADSAHYAGAAAVDAAGLYGIVADDAAGVNAAYSAYYASKDEMQGFVKNWIDNYFNAK